MLIIAVYCINTSIVGRLVRWKLKKETVIVIDRLRRKDAKPEEYHVNMRRKNVYDGILM